MKLITLILSIFTTFLMPIAGLLYLMLGFVVLDTAVGIYTSIQLNGIKSFKSHKFFNISIKLFFYLVTIILAFAVSVFIMGGSTLGIPFLIPKVLTAIFIYTEIKSVDESSMKLGNPSAWVLFKDFIAKLKDIKKDLNGLIDDDEKEEEK